MGHFPSERGLSGSPRVPQGPSGGSVDPLKGRAMERLRVSQVPQGLFSGDGSPTFGRPYSPCMELWDCRLTLSIDETRKTPVHTTASCLVGTCMLYRSHAPWIRFTTAHIRIRNRGITEASNWLSSKSLLSFTSDVRSARAPQHSHSSAAVCGEGDRP